MCANHTPSPHSSFPTRHFSFFIRHFSFITHHSAFIILPALAAAAYFVTAGPRIFYPYDLDFIEDSMLMQSLRYAQGQPVYAPPSADFAAHVYMPLYSWLGGILFKLFAPSFAPLRLLSFAAACATALMVYWIAQRESRLRWVGAACAGLFLGGYRLTGFWYELARVDSLFVALSLAGLAAGIYANGRAFKLILSAVFLAAAVFTKQTALLFGVGLALYLFIAIPRRAWIFVAAFAALTAVPFLAINAFTGGWFFTHTVVFASGDRVEVSRVAHYLFSELFGSMAGLSAMALAAGWLAARRSGWQAARDQPWLLATAAAAVISGVGRASVGGNLNNLMPIYTLLALSPAVLVREIQRRAPAAEIAPLPLSVTAALVILQFALGVYNPLRYMPTPQMRASGDRFIERLESIDGEVLVMMHPYYAWLAGKRPSAQVATLWYAYYWNAMLLPADFVSRIQRHYYAAIISDESLFETEPAIYDLITTYYVKAETLGAGDSPPTTTGLVVRPSVVYVPK